MALSPEDLVRMYAKGSADWAKMTPGEREALVQSRLPSTYNPAKLQEMGEAKGGRITKVAGKKRGKDDGLIPAKRGEYVVRKSSTSKYGAAKMAAVNRGTAIITTRAAPTKSAAAKPNAKAKK